MPCICIYNWKQGKEQVGAMNSKIYIKQPDYTQLSSIFMGKDIYFHWRGQSDVLYIIDYAEWYKFVSANINILRNRPVIQYQKVLSNGTRLESKYRRFYYDVAWAQFTEVVLCTNCNLNATMIFPNMPSCSSISFDEVVASLSHMSKQDKEKELAGFQSATNAYLSLKGQYDAMYCKLIYDTLSDWNKSLLDVAIYLKLRSSGSLMTDRLNITKG